MIVQRALCKFVADGMRGPGTEPKPGQLVYPNDANPLAYETAMGRSREKDILKSDLCYLFEELHLHGMEWLEFFREVIRHLESTKVPKPTQPLDAIAIWSRHYIAIHEQHIQFDADNQQIYDRSPIGKYIVESVSDVLRDSFINFIRDWIHPMYGNMLEFVEDDDPIILNSSTASLLLVINQLVEQQKQLRLKRGPTGEAEGTAAIRPKKGD